MKTENRTECPGALVSHKSCLKTAGAILAEASVMKSRWALFSILYSHSRKLKVRKDFQCQICDSSKNWANLCQGTRRISTHMWYVNGAWTYNKFCAIRFGAFVLDFSPDFSCTTVEIVPFARALLWYIVQVRYCDLDNINSAMQTIWAQQSTSSMLLLHGAAKLRVKRGVGQIYIVQSKQALPINYNHGTLEEGKKKKNQSRKNIWSTNLCWLP